MLSRIGPRNWFQLVAIWFTVAPGRRVGVAGVDFPEVDLDGDLIEESVLTDFLAVARRAVILRTTPLFSNTETRSPILRLLARDGLRSKVTLTRREIRKLLIVLLDVA
jgi:hypothetical protein